MDIELRSLLDDLLEYMAGRQDTQDDPPSEDGPSVSPNEEMVFVGRITDALEDTIGPYKVQVRAVEIRFVIRGVPKELEFAPYEHRAFTQWKALTEHQQMLVRACADESKVTF